MEQLRYHDILYDDSQLGPYPDHLLKRVDRPTNPIPGPVERVSARETVYGKSLMGDFGERTQREFKRMENRYPVNGALSDLQRYLTAYANERKPVASRKAPVPDDPRAMSRHLKALGYFLGADIVRIGPLSQSAVYSQDMRREPIEVPFRYAIVLAARKYTPALSASNGWDKIVSPLSFQVYTKLALQTEVMANYLRRLGIDALPSNMWNYVNLMPQVALEAGMGEVSRMGIVLNPFFGCNCKYAAVFTNLELEVDGCVDFGLQEYCNGCLICAEQCPSHAITRGRQTLHNGYYTWKLNAKACSDFAILSNEGGTCGRCTKVCPWNRPHMDGRDFAGWDGSLDWLRATVDEQRERTVANGFVDPSEFTGKWWFRLDERDGEVVVPAERNSEKLCREYPIQE